MLAPAVAALVLVLATTATASSGGVAVTLSTNGVNYIIQHFIPVVEHAIENVTIAGISGTVSAVVS